MKKEKNKISKYLIISGKIYLYCIIFSLFAIIFLADGIHNVLSVIFGFVFLAPTLIVVFASGRSAGEKDFKLNASMQDDKNSNVYDKNSNVYKAVEMNYLEVVYSLLFFAVPLIILTVLGTALKNNIIHAVPFFVFMPMSLIFSTIGVVTVDPISAWSLAIYIPSVLMICAAYIAGYIVRVRKMRNDRRDIASELRMFNN